SLDTESRVGLRHENMLLLQVLQQLPVRSGDLLSRDEAVHHVVEALCGQHQLDGVERSAAVDVANPFVEELVAHAHMRLQSGQLGVAEANMPAEVVDRALRLGDERLLRGNLLSQTDYQ